VETPPPIWATGTTNLENQNRKELAGGYFYRQNSYKVLYADLIYAMAKELVALLTPARESDKAK